MLLQTQSSWAGDTAVIRRMLNDYLGAAGPAIRLFCTESNVVPFNPNKQTTSLVSALFKANTFGLLLQTEFQGLVWWDLRNGEGQFENAPGLYGWRQYGDYGEW